ncbi:MAG: ABC transporter ATP-binding protein [Collinsella sp.]|nr:ABC transporter ATP-binding protein [Collinsella sp.]
MGLLFRFMRPYRKLVVTTVLVLMVDIAGTLLVPTLLANMVNIGVATGDFDYIVHNGIAMLGATILASGGALLGSYLSSKLASSVARDIRNAVYDSSLAFSGGDFERFGTGSMITRTLNDINVIQQAIIMTIQMVLPVPIMCVMGIILAMAIDYQMGTLLAIVVAVVLTATILTITAAAPIFTRLQRFIDRMNVVLRENITGVRVIRAFNEEERENARLDDVFSRYARAAIKVNWLFASLDCAAFFLMNLTEVAILWLGGNRVGAGAMEIGSISAVLEYAMLILFFIMMAQIVALTLPRAKACLDRAAEVIDLVPEIRDKVRGTVDLGSSDADRGLPSDEDSDDVVAAFSHVTFRFSDADEDTLHDIDFECRRGQTTAIIGSTGSGKSTVVKLLLRFHDVTGGAVRFCGRDVRGLAQRELRERISYVPQKAWLFSGTIADNLRHGKADATEGEMRHALAVAQGGFVDDLPEGLDAPVSQGGTNFSGGQRQRLSIARALMKHADLYIFDDSFSALDFKTDAALRRALKPEMADAAMLIIAQRINTILHADQIIVLKDGSVVGRGTHGELMESCEVYRAIAESQMKGGE